MPPLNNSQKILHSLKGISFKKTPIKKWIEENS